ncbi:MAG: glycosyltransferase family 39 protein [Streptosporangiaceae bacterium]
MSIAVDDKRIDPLEWAEKRRWLDWTLYAGPAVTLGLMTWGIGAKAFSGDESDTVSAVSRSVPQLIRMLGFVDSVHGLYYLLLWPVAAVAGTGEFAIRFPSALAMAAAAAGVTAIGRRLVSRRAGLCAGLIFAILPFVSAQGQNARPYAMATASAVLCSYLFIRTLQDPRPRWFTGYGLSLVLLGYLHMFGLLLVAAQVVTLIGLSWRYRATTSSPFGPARRWLVTFAAVGVAVSPVLIVGWTQRVAISWIDKPNWQAVVTTARLLTANSGLSMLALGALGLLGVLCGTRVASALSLERAGTAPDAGRMIGWLALPWLVLPPALLLAVSEFMPVYDGRYITYCLPATALLAGTGLAALWLPVRVVAFVLVLAMAMPAQLSVRQPVQGMLVVSRFLNAHEKPGDAIVYPRALIPPWNLAYPEGFAPLRDLSLDQTGAASDRLFGTTVSLPVLKHRELSADRIWVVEQGRVNNPASHLIPAFHLAHRWTLRGYLTIWLYTKGT